MAEFIPFPPAGPANASPLPSPHGVRLEVRDGDGPARTLHFDQESILVGSVAGCDVRLPGGDLPPLVCLLLHRDSIMRLRKLAPAQLLLLNGTPTTDAVVRTGDRLTLGCFALTFQIGAAPPELSTHQTPEEQTRLLTEGLRKLKDAQNQFDEDRRDWEQDAERQAEALALRSRHLLDGEKALAAARNELDRLQTALTARETELAARAAELPQLRKRSSEESEKLEQTRQRLLELRQLLYDRYRRRRDHLILLQESVRHSASKVQAEKRDAAELQKREAAVTAEAERLAEQRRLIDDWQRDSERETAERTARVAAVDARLTLAQRELAQSQSQHRDDLARLERLHATLQQRQGELDQQARDLAVQANLLQKEATELIARRQELDTAAERSTAAADLLATRQAEFAAAQRQLHQRTEAIESQQVALVGLRSRTERLQTELFQREQLLTEQRLRQSRMEEELRLASARLHEERATIRQEREEWQEQRQQVEQHCAGLEASIAHAHEVQASFDQQVGELGRERTALEAERSRLAQQTAALRLRADRLERFRARLHAQRQELRGHASQVLETDEARLTFQEQLRQRADVLSDRENRLAEREQQHQALADHLATLQTTWETDRQRLGDELAQLQRAAQQRDAILSERERDLQKQLEELQTALRTLESDQATLIQERARVENRERQAAALLDRTQRETAGIQTQLPDLIRQVHAALDRLGKTREQLRDHLAEVHQYAQQSQAESEAAQGDLAAHAERLRQQQHALTRTQDEHRHAVSSFRQYLSEWQGQIAELKRSLGDGESVLQRRQAQLAEQARTIEASSQQLSQRAEVLDDQERDIAERRDELNRQLSDMQQWYRQKLRELAERNLLTPAEDSNERPDVLSFHTTAPTADLHLAEQLVELGLIEDGTLGQILDLARVQRTSLRSALLGGGYLTPFQMDLIEAGNLPDLVVGPLRLVDRLRQSSVETIYRVFDPRRGQEGVLRVLSANVGADQRAEFLERFIRAAAFRHPHVAATWEVLDAAGQPAALQEWTIGVPSHDWGAVAASPSVWVRLLAQTAAGLQAAHEAGIEHGHLAADRILLTEPGDVKICGFGEPHWLISDQTAPPVNDLEALGEIAVTWLTHSARKAISGAHREALKPVLHRLLADDATVRFPTAAALLDHLHDVTMLLPNDGHAWSKLLNYIHERLRPELPLRQSA